jgi:hypothetical protein
MAIKLNLGCGKNPMPGYVNVDKFGTPDVRHDLETFPWHSTTRSPATTTSSRKSSWSSPS